MSDSSSTPDRDALHLRLIDHLSERALEPGDQLPGELDLAQEMNVSRPQVREGLRMLEALGVVRSRQGARRTWLGFSASAFAHQLAATLRPSARAVVELLDIRQALETAMLPRAMALMTVEDKDALQRIALEMVERAENGETFTSQDEQFHRLILASLNNELLNGLHAAFWSVYGSYTEHHPPNEDPVPVARMHLRIAEAVKTGDTKRAVHELDAHYYGVRARVSPQSVPSASVEIGGAAVTTP